MVEVYSLENEVFASFVKYGSLVVAKMLLMATVTVFVRNAKKSFANAEDAKRVGGITDPDKLKIALKPDDSVERTRRAHMNDIENVIPFILISLMYTATNPVPATAELLFKIFAVSRICHTFFYLFGLQPFRGLCWMIGYGVCMLMSYKVISTLWFN